eukprot:TRINITY_DN18089_c0_g1_i1.p1 TRINITY_DN18089_c0_g1~~TRINITY_DN18089_c0_g1_i1.p1  ORF type:complete len:822 (+),score=209.34 TRINITY_DN18089_c0_g1_i1:104-2569(+)
MVVHGAAPARHGNHRGQGRDLVPITSPPTAPAQAPDQEWSASGASGADAHRLSGASDFCGEGSGADGPARGVTFTQRDSGVPRAPTHGSHRRRTTRLISFAPPVSLRQKVYALLDPSVPAATPAAAQAATVLSLVIFFLIFLSITVFCVESHPSFYRRDNVALFAIETVCVSVFTLEWAVKLITCDDKESYLRSTLNMVDLLSIVPYYINLIVAASTSGGSAGLESLVFMRVVRLARVFRVFKLGKYYKGFQLVIYAMRQSSEALSLLGFLLGICLVLFASLVFIAEQSEADFEPLTSRWEYNWHRWTPERKQRSSRASDPGVSEFQSIPDSLWWSLVTLATVGYGDQVPRTWAGKGVGMLAMTVGVLVLAFPIILISNNFSEAVREYNAHQQEVHAALEGCREEDRSLALLAALGDVDDVEQGGSQPADAFPPPAQAAWLTRTQESWEDAAALWPQLREHVATNPDIVCSDYSAVTVTAEWMAKNWNPRAPEHWRLLQVLSKLCVDRVWGDLARDRNPPSQQCSPAGDDPVSPLGSEGTPDTERQSSASQALVVSSFASADGVPSAEAAAAALPPSPPPPPPAPQPAAAAGPQVAGTSPPPRPPPLERLAGPPPEPGPRSVVTHFRWGGKMRAVYYVSRLGPGMCHFRYDPLFIGPSDRDDDACGVDHLEDDAYVLHVDVVLDCDAAQDAAVEAVRSSALFAPDDVRKENTFALQLAKITISIPMLHSSARLLTREFASPGNALGVQLAVDGEAELAALRKRLPEYCIRCQCATSFGSRPPSRGGRADCDVSVPLMAPVIPADGPLTALTVVVGHKGRDA